MLILDTNLLRAVERWQPKEYPPYVPPRRAKSDLPGRLFREIKGMFRPVARPLIGSRNVPDAS